MRRWRITELAELGEVTEQQVRNYLDAGLLPPAARAANNYRILTDQHADALRTARALAAGHGWPVARTILAAVHRGDLPAALAAVDEGHATLARERATIAAAVAAFGEVAVGAPAATARRPARIGRVAAEVGVRAPVLRLWEWRGLLRPERDPTGYRVYGPAEQRAAHLVAVLRAGGFAFAIIEAAIGALRADGGVEQALARLARRDEQVAAASRRRLAATAALHAYLAAYFPPG